MLNSCTTLTDYASSPAPWSNISKDSIPALEAVEAEVAQPIFEELMKMPLRTHDGITQKRMSFQKNIL